VFSWCGCVVSEIRRLDFGLAKLAGPAEAGHYVQQGVVGFDRSVRLQPDLTASPTVTSPAMLTGMGTILGTAAYMAPEQAKGRPADKRSDVWAFGCVLYEMLTGRRAFEGDDASDTMAAVLRAEPDWTACRRRRRPAFSASCERVFGKIETSAFRTSRSPDSRLTRCVYPMPTCAVWM
jgi:serine/threonine protein kinase